MENEHEGILVVEEGEGQGSLFRLVQETTLIGRGESQGNKIVIDNAFVSRSHAQIVRTERGFLLRDLGSKNGTSINGRQIEPQVDHSLSDGDLIELARGVVALRFHESEGTADLPGEEFKRLAGGATSGEKAGILVDVKARDVWVDGERLAPSLALKDFELLAFLYENRGAACSKDEIASRVWPDEFVTDEQIEQCVRRVRKRVEPDPYRPRRIITMRGYGYKLAPDA